MNFASGRSLSRSVREMRAAFEKIKQLVPRTSRDADPLFIEIMKFVNSVWSTRNVELATFENFFAGDQKKYFRKYQEESDDEYAMRLDQSVQINKCRQTVLKGARFLYTVKPPYRRMEDDKAHDRMMDVWKYNSVISGHFHRQLALEAGLYGFVVVENRYVNKKTKERVWVRAKTEGNEVQYVMHRPMLTIPIPRKEKQDEMGAVILIEMENRSNPLFSADLPEIKSVTFVSDTEWRKWLISKGSNSSTDVVGIPIEVDNGPRFINQNPYGDVNSVFTLYRNVGESGFVLDGASDLVDITEMNNRYNQLVSDDGHVIDHHTFPILASFGFKLPANFKHGVNTNISTNNSEGDLKYVVWEADLEASKNLEDRLERQIRESSGYSSVSDGDLTNIGQVRNLRGAMVPEMLTIGDKQVAFSKCEKDHAKATLEIIEWHEMENYEDKDLDITFRPFVPVDRLTEVEADTMEVKAGLEDIRDVIRRRNPEIEDEEEINRKVREIAEVNKMLGIVPTDGSDKRPSGQSGSPEKKEKEQLEG